MSLSDLVPRKPSPSPSLGPDCPRHPLNLASYCRECRKEEQLLWGARQLVDKRQPELRQRVHEAMQRHASAIQRDSDAILERMVREYREDEQTLMAAGNEARQPYFAQALEDCEEQLLNECLSELRSKQ